MNGEKAEWSEGGKVEGWKGGRVEGLKWKGWKVEGEKVNGWKKKCGIFYTLFLRGLFLSPTFDE